MTPQQEAKLDTLISLLVPVHDALFNKKGSKKGDNKSIVGGEALDDLINKGQLKILAAIESLKGK
jgi:hypothetical protein